MDIENKTVLNKGKTVDMEIRAFDSDKDFKSIKNWATDERIHSMWCANRFKYPLEKEDFTEALKGVYERYGDLAYVAVIDDTPVGFFCYSYNCDTREGMLKFVIVDPFYRGKGVAREMFDLILQHAFNETDAEAVQLMVFPQNPRAKSFYEKIGFKERRTVTGAFSFKDESWDRCNMVVKKKHVVVHSYEKTWADDFAAIRDELNTVLKDIVIRIEHVGSTSVEGLSAKPIIDIDVVIQDRADLPEVISALQKIGYSHEGDQGIPEREVFKYEEKEHLRKHHLYVCTLDAEELRSHIAFRDYLRNNPEAVAEYSRIKEEGALLYPWDIDKYIEHKSPFIESIYKRIGLI